jgi:hypothetical protein
MTIFKVATARFPVAAVLAALVVLSTSCAALFSGPTQTVPVTSQPARAEVVVDGRAVGFTPIELELERGRDHTVVVRWGGQQRTVVVRSDVQPGPLVLDLVPVAVSASLLYGINASDFFHDTSESVAFTFGVLAVSFAPLLVDVGSGALHQLTPGEIIVAFDGR